MCVRGGVRYLEVEGSEIYNCFILAPSIQDLCVLERKKIILLSGSKSCSKFKNTRNKLVN